MYLNVFSTFIILVLSNITKPSTSTDAEPSHSQATSSQAAKAALDKEKAQREHHRTKFNDWLDNGYISFIFHLVIFVNIFDIFFSFFSI